MSKTRTSSNCNISKKDPEQALKSQALAAHYDPYMDVREAAKYCGYHEQTIREEIRMRNLAASRLAAGSRARYRIRLSELNRWMRDRENKISKFAR